MGLPLYLAMTEAEMARCPGLPRYMGVFFTDGQENPPPGAMLILTDREPLQTPDPARLQCAALLLDLERPPEENTRSLVLALAEALPCPVAAPPGFVENTPHAVFLPPCPLHVPLEDWLRPWRGREIWLDFTLRQQTITVTTDGTAYGPAAPADRQGGIYDERLCCQVIMEQEKDAVRFTLFDTAETLQKKLAQAEALGVARAVGLYQELGPLMQPQPCPDRPLSKSNYSLGYLA